jgi:hypothetical protein
MEQAKIVPKTVSLYPDDWAVVQQVAKDTGQRSMSGGLRFIIADWARRAGREVSLSTDHDEETV